MHGHAGNPEIEKARKELEKLKQREHELEERLSIMYANAGDNYSTIVEEEEEFHGEGAEDEKDGSEERYKNVYNGYLQNNGHSIKNHVNDEWIEDASTAQLSSIHDHRENRSYSTLARAITDKRVVNPSTMPSRTSGSKEVSSRNPYPGTNEFIPQKPSAIMDIISSDGENGEKQDVSSSYVPEDSDFEEHLFYHAYEERTSENIIDYYGKGEEDLSSSEIDEDAVDQRSEIHREIKINQQRERELRYERNMLSDGSETASNSDSESVASALSIRSKILKEIEEERLRDMEIHDQYKMRGLITKGSMNMRSHSSTSFDEALKQQPSEKDCTNSVKKSDVNNSQLLSPAGVAGMVLTGGGDASLRSKDNEEALLHHESMKRLQRVLTEEGDDDTGDSASEFSEINTLSSIDMRSRILREIEEEQKREKELKIRLRRITKRNAALVAQSPTSQVSVSNTVNQTILATSIKMPNTQPSPPTTPSGNLAHQVSKQNSKNAHCSKEDPTSKIKTDPTSKIKTLRGITQSKKMEKPAKSGGVVQSSGATPEHNHIHNGNARTLSEIDKCTFSSREDLVAFLGTEEAGGNGEKMTQELDVQPLKIPKVFTVNTSEHDVNRTISHKSPKSEREEEFQNRLKNDRNYSIISNSPLIPISSRIPDNSLINPGECTKSRFAFNSNISEYPNTPKHIDVPDSSSSVKTNESTGEQGRNKFSVYFEAEHQYLNHSYDEEKSRRKDFEKQIKRGNRSSRQAHAVKNEDAKGFKSPVKCPTDDGAQRLSKPVTVSFTISKTIQRWERRIKKNAMLTR